MEQLPDSTDWISTSLPLFEPLEAALRCEVCKEFYENPVITTCSHTFCSLCIRRCISHDGKCPACRSSCSADRLVANVAVREFVSRFQDARPSALALARQATKSTSTTVSKKRKQDDAEISEAGSQRVTRSRTARSSNPPGNGMANSPVEVLDSEDDGDGEFVPDEIPEGMVACPVCSAPMKEEQMWAHLAPGGSCPGAENATGGRSSKSKFPAFTESPLKKQRRGDSPAPMKLSGLNYALMKETQLRKKLQELGIPSGGNKDAMKRRHQEWLNLWNANLDASEDEQKPKRELLRKLNEWERTRGAGANATEAAVMRKDYDGKSHIHRYKSEFDELIAAAREKRVQRKSNDERESSSQPAPTDADPNADAPEADAHNSHDEPPAENASTKPYEDNESALSKVRGKVQETNLNGTVLPPVSPGRESPSQSESQQQIASASTGMANPFVSPSKRLPMFTLPEDPIIDVENSASAP